MTMRRTQRRPRLHDHARYVYRIDRNTTIVAVRGEIDAYNAAGMLLHAQCRNTTGEPALVLDLTGLKFLGTQGLFTLIAIGQQCHRAAIPWITVPSPAVNRLLQLSRTHGEVRTAETVPVALDILGFKPPT
ncbi:STAS domain-containing protein [Mycobacterium sp. pW049]|uniref:STAS domain-containing protein n=1 Tax=[Mycobacterium] bulgaricum TaxID=3238985 RepID=UPI00351B9133